MTHHAWRWKEPQQRPLRLLQLSTTTVPGTSDPNKHGYHRQFGVIKPGIPRNHFSTLSLASLPPKTKLEQANRRQQPQSHPPDS